MRALTSRTFIAPTAVISDCGRYRYALIRGGWLKGEGTVLFVMLNPSTADATRDDPTIRRCVRFAQSWGYARLAVANLYALRATDPRELRCVDDPVGPDNDDWIVRLACGAREVVAAWGAHASQGRANRVVELIERCFALSRVYEAARTTAPAIRASRRLSTAFRGWRGR